MSLQRNGTRHHGEEDEVCPVCKSSRYLNPDMRFLINPECYHKMCESCVDRIFSAGPAPCPIAGCRKTLRKHRFRKQTFDDIGVEREVDIRKRVMQILNRREEEFATKRDWDDFLEQREEIIANLVAGTDVSKTESQLKTYAAENEASIRTNKALEAQESASLLESQALEQEQIRRRREAALEDFERERRELLANREQYISRLAAGSADQAEAIAQEGNRVLLKKSSARRSEEDRIKRKQAALLSDSKKAQAAAAQASAGATVPGSGLIKGLKRIKTPEPEKPYDPFAGLSLAKKDYYTLKEDYPSTYLDPIRKDTRMLAGGYDLKEYYARTLLEAFAGLGCFIDEEAAARNPAASLNASMGPSATELAASAAGSTPVAAPTVADDDVF